MANVYRDLNELEEDVFDCPRCGVKSKRSYIQIHSVTSTLHHPYFLLNCGACDRHSLWKYLNRRPPNPFEISLVDPVVSSAVKPNDDMPEDVKSLFEEARTIHPYSPRATAALLRLALQLLLKHMGEEGKNINDDIRSLAANRPEFGDQFIDALDIVRIVGNESVHPGTIDINDLHPATEELFKVLNIIVTIGISNAKSLQGLQNILPKEKLDAAKKADQRARDKVNKA